MLYTNYDKVVLLTHPSGDSLGYATIDSVTGIEYTESPFCDSYCDVGEYSEFTPIDMKSRFMTEPLWVLGGWCCREDFNIDCHNEGYGKDSGTGWVERQLNESIPMEYLRRRF